MQSLIQLDEDFKANRNSRDVMQMADKYRKRFRKYMDMLENHSLVSKVRNITEWDHYTLGHQLENFQDYLSICEAEGTLNQLGVIPDVAFDVVTVA